jgi:sec-independent protein translocase protein TatA
MIHTLGFIDFGAGELMFVMLAILMLFGGKRMPELARGLGRAIREFKKATAGVEEQLKRALDEAPPENRNLPGYPSYPPPLTAKFPLTPIEPPVDIPPAPPALPAPPEAPATPAATPPTPPEPPKA